MMFHSINRRTIMFLSTNGRTFMFPASDSYPVMYPASNGRTTLFPSSTLAASYFSTVKRLSRRTTLFPAVQQKFNWENTRPHLRYCSPNLEWHASYSHLSLFRLQKTSRWGPGHSDSMYLFQQKYIAVRIIGVLPWDSLQKLQPDIIG